MNNVITLTIKGEKEERLRGKVMQRHYYAFLILRTLSVVEQKKNFKRPK